MKIFFVLGSDLARDEKGNVTLGPDTQKACELAVELCYHAGNGSVIIATAGAPPKSKWGDVWMAQMMGNSIVAMNQHLRLKIEKAEVFSISSEVEALVTALPKMIASHHLKKVDEIVIIAKDSQVSCARRELRSYFKQKNIDIPIVVESYKSVSATSQSFLKTVLKKIRNYFS